MKVYKNPRKSIVEFVDDAGKSALRYRGHDRKLHYVASSEDPEGGGGGMTETTWQELKDKRDAGKLTPGSLYRITDYQCTTTQENTQSAGHQFDIVLLALSENKLAEEGWAMMHDNIYDVTFADGVTKKCCIYVFDDEGNIYLVDVDTLLGYEGNINVFGINEDNKTAQTSQVNSNALTDEDLPYNYFQHSNLSAWKVWYCLDNDKSRFAWADDRSAIETSFSGQTFALKRISEDDRTSGSVNYYAWYSEEEDNTLYTITETPTTEDKLYTINDEEVEGMSITNYFPSIGRGVIYRLIDEYNNDVAYDFKNIQFVRPISGENTWVYTYTRYDPDNNIIVDTSLDGGMMDGFINDYNGLEATYSLSNNVILNPSGYCIKLVGLISGYCTISDSSGLVLFNCDSLEINGVDDAIYVAGKKVLTEE